MMRNHTRLVVALLSAAFLSACGQVVGNKRGGEVATVCSIPIGVDTYAAMTLENIGEHCVSDVRASTQDSGYQELLTLLGTAPSGEIEDGIVRVRICPPNDECIYVDDNGRVKWGAKQMKLGNVQLARVAEIVNRMVGLR